MIILHVYGTCSQDTVQPEHVHVYAYFTRSAAHRRALARTLNMYVANNSSILQYCHGMSIKGVLVFYCTTELR